MFNSEQYHNSPHQLKAEISSNSTSQTSKILIRSVLLKEFVNLFNDARIQVMLQESELQVMEYSHLRWISAISCYAHLGEQIKDNIQVNFQDWVIFRDATGILEIEVFTLPFINPRKDIIHVYLQDSGRWNDSSINYEVRPTLVWN